MSLEGRHILLGITGSIAAYKAAILCRLLKGVGYFFGICWRQDRQAR